MSDPFTPATPHLGSDEAQADAREQGRRQDPTGSEPEERSFTGSAEADADADQARRFGGRDPQQPDADSGPGRGDPQGPLDHNPGADMAENLGSNG